MIPIPSISGIATGRIILTALLAMAPAVVTWWADRKLLDRGNDPALPELLASRRRDSARVLAVAVALMIVFAGTEALWGVPLLVVLLVAAGYPVRTRILGETWVFGAYLWHTILSLVGGFGFWIALAYAPLIVQWLLRLAGTGRWWVAVPVAVALILWEHWYPSLWLRAHAARPLTRADLIPRFEAIVQRAASVVPAVYSVGPQGSRFVNAVALPSVRRPAIAMGDALLELLDAEEATAIFAHEMAHFDHLTPRWVRRAQLINRALILIGVALPIVASFYAPEMSGWVAWLWPIAVLFALAHRASASQQRETESDLRAAALCGDPETLVRALAKLHLHARVPRRWEVDVERTATHPSLVRRIQAIRAGGAAAAEQLGAATILRSPREGSWVVLDDARAHWLDGVPSDAAPELAALRDSASSYRAVNYQDLTELRVSAAGDRRTLHAGTRAGDAWTVPIAVEDVGRVQHALDVVDVRLGRASALSAPAASKFLAIVALSVAILAGQGGIVLVPAALALWKAGPASLAALGAMSLVRATLGAIDRNYWFSAQVGQLALLALGLVGVVSLVAVIRQQRGGASPADWRVTLGVLGAVTAVTAVAAASAVWQAGTVTFASLGGVPLVGTFGTALVGLAAALFTGPSVRTRRAAYGVLAGGAAVAALAVDRSAFSLRNALAETTAQATPVGESDLGGAGSGLRVSPSGEQFLAFRVPLGRRVVTPSTPTMVVGRVGGPVHEVSAIAGDFVDENRLLVLDVLEHGLEIRLERADTVAPPLWADTLAALDVEEPRLAIDRDAGTWTLIGASTDSVDNEVTVLVTGRIGEKGTGRRVALPDTLAMMGEPIVFGGRNTILAPVFSRTMQRGSMSVWSMAFFGGLRMPTELWRVRESGVDRVAVLRGVPQCGQPLAGAAACAVREIRTVSLYAVTVDGVATELARLPAPDLGVVAVGPGLRASSMTFERAMLIIDLAARRLTRVPLPAGSDYASEVRSGPGYIVTLSYAENRRSKVRRYRLD